MSVLETLRVARAELDQAKQMLYNNAKAAIEEELKNIFKDGSVENVAWAQKSSEYNDEGMYLGIAGPVVNSSYDDRWDWLYKESTDDDRLTTLREILKYIGEEILVDMYNDEYMVVATRTQDGTGIKLSSKSIGW